MTRPETGFIGAGRFARALAPLLERAGYPVVGFHSRGGASARRLARRIRGARAFATGDALAAASTLVLFAVPDGEVTAVARSLATKVAWPGKTALHHAGALGPAALAALRRRGAHTGVLHPLQVMADAAAVGRVLADTRVRIEGDTAAVRTARRVARDLGMRPLPLPPLGPAGRAAYHTAASLVANDAVALLGQGARLLQGLGLEHREAVRALVPLLRGAVEHAAGGDLRNAITGPVPRADAGTLGTHLEVLQRHSPEAERAHRALAELMISLLDELGDALDARDRRRLLRLLRSSGPTGERAV